MQFKGSSAYYKWKARKWMHPLSRLIFENPSFSAKELDTIITTYLKGRAKWLKEKWVEQGNWHKAYTYDHIDTAFELDEKCEKPCVCTCTETQKIMNIANIGCPIHKPPTLPSKLYFTPNGKDEPDLDEACAKTINKLIDYLHSKEAREE